MLAEKGWDRTTFGLAMAIQNLFWGLGLPDIDVPRAMYEKHIKALKVGWVGFHVDGFWLLRVVYCGCCGYCVCCVCCIDCVNCVKRSKSM